MAEGVGIPAERDTVKPRFGALNDCFAALMAATKFHFDGPSFTWMDQDPRGPWTRSPTRPHHPSLTHETGRGRPVFERSLVARSVSESKTTKIDSCSLSASLVSAKSDIDLKHFHRKDLAGGGGDLDDVADPGAA